jgi:hypothetical protein
MTWDPDEALPHPEIYSSLGSLKPWDPDEAIPHSGIQTRLS